MRPYLLLLALGSRSRHTPRVLTPKVVSLAPYMADPETSHHFHVWGVFPMGQHRSTTTIWHHWAIRSMSLLSVLAVYFGEL